jgi:hypothetical protein
LTLAPQDLAAVYEQRDLARLRLQAAERAQAELQASRDHLVAEVARLERRIAEEEGELARPEQARLWAERARQKLRRDQ